MKNLINNHFIFGAVSGILTLGIIQYVFLYVLEIEPIKIVNRPATNVKTEYFLEISEDSIWIENAQSHRTYGGTYSDLDSLTLIDNL
jgi:hypothetical protein